ncbi:MAG: transposase [Clostridia bacterium]
MAQQSRYLAPHYPSGKARRPSEGIERMILTCLLQIGITLSDPATEDAIDDGYAMRKLADIDFMTEIIPDETTLWKFRTTEKTA